jgi:hypothetical protein
VIAAQSAVTAYTTHMVAKERKASLNAVMAKSTGEFQMLQQQDRPKRKSRRPEHIQDDAGIPFGL